MNVGKLRGGITYKKLPKSKGDNMFTIASVFLVYRISEKFVLEFWLTSKFNVENQ